MNRTLILAVFAAFVGCGREAERRVEIDQVRVAEREIQLGRSTAERFDMVPHPPQHAPQSLPDEIFAWDLPAGWSEKPPSRFRLGSFDLPGGADCSLSMAGGSLAANLNRWRGQFGLDAWTEAEIEALPQKPFGAASGRFVQFAGSYQGMSGARIEDAMLLGLVVENADQLLFLKLTGPRSAVEAECEHFLAFAASIRPAPGLGDDGDVAGPVDGEASAGFDPGALRWTVPSTWAEQPSKSQMRLITLTAQAHPGAECWITVLPGMAGGVGPNINRWLNEVGQAPLDAAGLDGLPQVTVCDRAVPMVEAYGDYRGQDGSREGSGLLGVVCTVGSHCIFIKMVGSSEAVRNEKDRFVAFVESLEW